MEETTTADGETLYLSRRNGERGSKGPFFVVYRSPERERRYGYYCGHCESLDTAMDTMGRIKCNRCDNLRKPTEWDAAHE
ncbi:DUF5816 domain-containing protein [Halomicrococcus gelatinilyticus]|uniref:DUF5816 domain-containing protein n=1 Tax=Halomicrococcus gelatinilyticus TaxID=1702103 RepID=UPI002E147550